MSDGFVKVGKMKDAHGIRGELFIVLFAGEATWAKQLKTVRLTNEAGELKGEYAVKSIRPHKNGLIVKSEDIKDRNQAEALKGMLFEIPEAFLVSKKGDQIYLREIQGFTVTTKAQGVLGTIVNFSSNVAQDLLVVKTALGEFEIPFVKEFVIAIDYKAKRIDMDLPYGLLGEDDEDNVPDDGQSDASVSEDDE